MPDSSNDSHSTIGTPAPDILAAQAQIEAARRRQADLVAAGEFTKLSPRFDSPPPAREFPGYTVLNEIHRGGQGIVYQAMQQATHRKVAIKVLLEGVDASRAARHRFEREIELVAGLRHPNVISVFHSDQTPDGLRFCVMNYVHGVSITRFVRERHLGLREALRLFGTVCDAVNHAHQKGVIHRDLKPSNILVDAEGSPRVLDFGLAKLMGAAELSLVSQTGQVVGTLPYMSPEQTRGNPEEIDTRTDVYSLGVLLYELLTGRYPYAVTGPMAEVLRNIAEVEPTPPSRAWTADSGVSAGRGSSAIKGLGGRSGLWFAGWVGRGSSSWGRSSPIDDEVQTIVLKALTKERERRYQSAGELARDIEHYLAGEPIEAKRDSALYVLGKQVRRHKAPVAAALAFLLLLGGGLATSLTLWKRAETALVKQEAERRRADSFGGFLTEVLTLADPAKSRGEKVTVREALDKAAQRIDDGALRDQPLVEADVRFTIGSTYFALSLHPQAAAQLRAADAIRSRELGDEHRTTLLTRFRLAQSLINTHLPDAEKLAAATLEAQTRTLGPDDPDTLKSMVLLGIARAWSGSFADAEPLLLDAIQRRARVLGQDHAETAYFLNRLGEVYTEFTYPDKAEPLHREALRIHAQAFGEGHPDTITSSQRIAESLYNQARAVEAEAICRAVLPVALKVFGADHPGTHALQIDLAMSLSKQGRAAEAEQLYRETLAAKLRTVGPGDFDTIITQRMLADCLSGQGRHAEAETLLRDALAAATREFGAEAPSSSIRIMCALADILARQGKDVEAEQVSRQVIELQRRQVPRASPSELSQSVSALVKILRRRGAEDEARRLEQELIAFWLELASQPDAIAATLNDAAAALMASADLTLRDPPRALELARRANDLHGHQNPGHLRTLARAYLLTGDPALAVQTWEQVAALTTGDDARVTVLLSAAHQLLLVKPESLRDPARALPIAQRINEQTGHENPNHLSVLALACFENKDVQRAIDWQEKALAVLPADAPNRAQYEEQLAEFRAALAPPAPEVPSP